MNITQPMRRGFFNLGLTTTELEIIQIGLIRAKHEDFTDPEAFKSQRELCDVMYSQIDEELIASKS